MIGIALQVLRKRWLLSAVMVLMMMVMLLNTTATLGLLSYVTATQLANPANVAERESYYFQGDSAEVRKWFLEQQLGEFIGLTPFWQQYGFEVLDGDFVFLPIKVIHFSPSWKLNLEVGRLPEKEGEAVINAYMAYAYKLNVGDTLVFSGYDHKSRYTLVGLVYDENYESPYTNETRVFVHSPNHNHSTGVAFDLVYDKGEGHATFIKAYRDEFDRPLYAEHLSREVILNARVLPMQKPMLLAVLVWLIQFFLILYLLSQILRYLIRHNPSTLMVKGRMRFDFLDVYLNYLMLLILIAFLGSLTLLGPYVTTVTQVMSRMIGSLTPLRLLTIHMFGLGFWMNVLVILNALMQRRFVKETKQLQQMNQIPHGSYKNQSFLKCINSLIIANICVALLFQIQFVSTTMVDQMMKYPSLWGFANTTVRLNVEGDTTIKGYTYEPVVILGKHESYAKGVVSQDGFEQFGISLIRGRLPKWPNEIVVGVGLTHKDQDLGSRVDYYNTEGFQQGVIVGVANAVIDQSQILGYMATRPTTFSFDPDAPGKRVDFFDYVSRHYSYIRESVSGYLTPLVMSMVLLGLIIVAVLYVFFDESAFHLRRLVKGMHLKRWRLHIVLGFYAVGMSGIAYLISQGLWTILIEPALSSEALKMGIDRSSFGLSSHLGFVIVMLLTCVNWVFSFIVINHEGDLFQS